jgi:uncharacterized protein (TIGR02246 family)
VTTRPFINSALALAVLAACAKPPAPAPSPPDTAAIKAALDKELAKYLPLLQAKDAAGTAAMFTDDATWILPDASTFVGKAAIQAGAKGFFDALDSYTGESATIDKLIVVNDSEAVTFSHGIGMMKMKGGKKAEQHNNPFADYWKKGADGTWRIAYEVNADGVVPEAKPAAAPKKP